MYNYDEFEEREQFDMQGLDYMHGSEWFDGLDDVHVDFEVDDDYNINEH